MKNNLYALNNDINDTNIRLVVELFKFYSFTTIAMYLNYNKLGKYFMIKSVEVFKHTPNIQQRFFRPTFTGKASLFFKNLGKYFNIFNFFIITIMQCFINFWYKLMNEEMTIYSSNVYQYSSTENTQKCIEKLQITREVICITSQLQTIQSTIPDVKVTYLTFFFVFCTESKKENITQSKTNVSEIIKFKNGVMRPFFQ